MKTRKTKTISKSILNKIDAINQMLPIITTLDEIPLTYAGGTFPYWVELNSLIEVKNQYVYIDYIKTASGGEFGDGMTRYNTNKTDEFDDNGLAQLKYDLNIIHKAFKTAIKRDKIRF